MALTGEQKRALMYFGRYKSFESMSDWEEIRADVKIEFPDLYEAWEKQRKWARRFDRELEAVNKQVWPDSEASG